MRERGAHWGPAFLAVVYRALGRGVCVALTSVVVLYFFLTGSAQRRASRDYLKRVDAWTGGSAGAQSSLRHFLSFGESLVDRFGAWIGRIDRTELESIDSEDFQQLRADPRGALILSAHFGATELVRAIAVRERRRRVSIVMHTDNAARYNATLQRFAPQSQVSVLPAGDFGIESAVAISAAIERGDWVVMMGDRLPVTRGTATIKASFLGAEAEFPRGPFVLATALHCPVYTLFCYRVDGRHRVSVSRLSEGVAPARRDREKSILELLGAFCRELERLVAAAPYQWFNFYDFWAAQPKSEERSGGGNN